MYLHQSFLTWEGFGHFGDIRHRVSQVNYPIETLFTKARRSVKRGPQIIIYWLSGRDKVYKRHSIFPCTIFFFALALNLLSNALFKDLFSCLLFVNFRRHIATIKDSYYYWLERRCPDAFLAISESKVQIKIKILSFPRGSRCSRRAQVCLLLHSCATL